MREPLQRGWRQLIDALERSEATLRGSAAFGSDAERAAGYAHLTRSLIKALQAEVLQDADYPYFRVIDFWQREGGDNPDQRYGFAPLRGGEPYRIWGRLGSARRVELQLYAGEPWAASGRSVGHLPFESLRVEADGRFEAALLPGAAGPGDLHNPPEATSVCARQIYDHWSADDPGEVHIDRVGYEGRRRPAISAAELGDRLDAAAGMLERTAAVWPAFIQDLYVAARPPNTLSPLHDSYARGGVRGRWMANAHYALTPGRAVVVRMPRTEADYQGIQLADMWFASLEYGNQISSLCAPQSRLAPDDAYHVVISLEDPGYPNWLDPGAFERGVLLLRYDGVEGEIPPDRQPSLRELDLAELPEAIPGFERVDPAGREDVRRERRRHLQVRFGR